MTANINFYNIACAQFALNSASEVWKNFLQELCPSPYDFGGRNTTTFILEERISAKPKISFSDFLVSPWTVLLKDEARVSG